MSIEDIVRVVITSATKGVQQAGFGVPLIVSHTATWTERTRTYTSITAVGSDFATTTSEYKAAAAIFAQSPRPKKLMIGRANDAAPTQRWMATVISVGAKPYALRTNSTTTTHTGVLSVAWVASTAYVTGDLVTNDTGKGYVCITAGTSAGSGGPTGTNADITDGTVHWMYAGAVAVGAASNDAIVYNLKKSIDTLSLALTLSLQGSVGSKTLRILANTAGAWFAVEAMNLQYLSLVQDHDAPSGLATALDAIELEDGTWYGLSTSYNSSAYVLVVAAWAETAKKIYFATLCDSTIVNTADSGATDVAHSLKTSAYARTAPMFHTANDSFAAEAWAGAVLPLVPGSETWKFKTLAGVPAVTFTGTQITNVEAKKCNYYSTVGGLNITQQGVTSSGEYIDVIRGIDWLRARLAERIFGRLANAKKIPFTDPGVAIIEAEVRAQLKEAIAVGLLAASPEPTVTVPLVADVSANDKAARTLPDVEFAATLAGAIHIVDPLNGVVSV